MVGVPADSLIGSGRVTEELHRAAAEGELETVVRLIGLGANVDSCDQNDATPLQKASCGGHIEVVQHLLKKCASVDHQDSQHGNTALHEASWKGYSQTTECLVKAKSNVYLKNQGGFAPLHLACQNGHNQTCRVLLLAGCRPDIKNNYGDTPIHTAARYGHAGVTRILLSARADVKETNKNGDTGLHIAAAMGRRKLTRMLLEADADQTIKNKQGETPADIAIRKDFPQILEILRNPPKVLSIEERVKQEQMQKREEANKNKERGRKDKKRDKMNDSGTSSKESGTKPKEKKKLKGNPKIDPKTRSARLSSWGVEWSPYGCHVAPPTDNTIVPPKLDSLPTDPLIRGEQYFVDLAGNIKKGPVGIGSQCFCAPLFQTVQNKMEKDKIDLMDHIDQAHGRLNDRISSLETHTKGHIQKLGQTVQEKELAVERAECRAQNCRLKETQEAELDRKVVQLQSWIERRLSNHHPDSPTSVRKRWRDSLNRTHPLTRSRSEEAISEIRGENSEDEEPLYKGLRVLDHPTSMYNIPHNVDMETEMGFDGVNPQPSLHDSAAEEAALAIIASRTDRKRYLQSLFDLDQRYPSDGAAKLSDVNGQHPSDRPTGLKSKNMSENCLVSLDNFRQRTDSDLVRPRTRVPLVVDPENYVSESNDNRDGAVMLDEAVNNLHVGDKSPISIYPIVNGHPSRYEQLARTDHLRRSDQSLRTNNNIIVRQYDTDALDGEVRRRNLPNVPLPSNFPRSYSKPQVDQMNRSRIDLRPHQEIANSSHDDSYRINQTLDDSYRINQSHDMSPNVTNEFQDTLYPPVEHFESQTPERTMTSQSRYHFRNDNPYMYNLRGNNPEHRQPYSEGKPQTPQADIEERISSYGPTPQKPPVSFNLQPTQSYHASVVYNSPDNSSTYLDMDRFRIQAAVKKLYDGYLADGHMEAPRPNGRVVLETSAEHDSHNDSGYSTRLCSASQGPSPALPGGSYAAIREEIGTNGLEHQPGLPPFIHYAQHHAPYRLNGRYTDGEPPALVSHNTSSSLSESEVNPVLNGSNNGIRSPHQITNGGSFIGESSLV